MEKDKSAEGNSFSELGLEIRQGAVEVGNTYPIFGMITKLINDQPGQVVAEINYGIHARMNIPDSSNVEMLRQRAFESGIFIATVIAKEPTIEVECQTVIFGRPQAFNA